ncbi:MULTISPECIES: DUF2905 family protein [Oxalobacteraceae]|jgi:hypothetical protein|uniref:DUF2905 family protein n=1 Tax=Oxalobacteraceae TaxID=75682 RepID=UPI0010A3AF02|nr:MULTISPECIES: DUF2905 family protein [Oxalobacteraceae]
MIRWVAAIFVGLFVFYPLLPVMGRLGVGRVPGDVRFRVRSANFCLPFGSTLLWSIVAFAIAQVIG